MKTVTFWGSSDDLVEIDGCKGADEFCVNVKGIHGGTFKISSPKGATLEPAGIVIKQELLVHALYDGSWSFAVGKTEHEEYPDWPSHVMPSEHNGYSMSLEIKVPDDAVVWPVQ